MPKKSHSYLNALLFFRISLLALLTSCAASKVDENASISLRFLDDYIISENIHFQDTPIGGLSGIDFDGKNFYLVCDQPSNPRIYQMHIPITQQKIDTVIITDMISFRKNTTFTKSHAFDLEAVLYNTSSKKFTLVSEGAIKQGKKPSVFEMDSTGTYQNHYQLPSYFNTNSPRNNGVFESLTESDDKKGIWIATELPLTQDGVKPKLYRTKSPVRFTYFDKNLRKAKKQFTYFISPIRRFPLLPFALNGVTDILTIDKHRFLVLERSFSAGRGKRSYSVKIYEANSAKATNTLTTQQLKNKGREEIIPAAKKLVFDFRSIRKKLKNKQIDNIEGMCFGPTLANGNRSLILIADNNFSSFMQQYNQVILMEIITQ